MTRLATSRAEGEDVEEEDGEEEVAGLPGEVGEERMSGWTIRLGEYVLMTVAAVGVQMTWDWSDG